MTEQVTPSILKKDLITGHEQEYGLKLGHKDPRRGIYTIADRQLFLAHLHQLGIATTGRKIRQLFEDNQDGLTQYFDIYGTEPVVLGQHFHTAVGTPAGTGRETFIVTYIGPETTIKVETNSLGKNTGRIRTNLRSGAVIVNEPGDYHTFTVTGSFTMVQVTEAPEFKKDDLNQFYPDNSSPETRRLVKGTFK